MATIEKTFTVEVESGETSVSKTIKLPAGNFLGVVAYPSPTTNPGIIRASIKNVGLEPVSELQHIENYRSRNCEYSKDFKDLDIPGGAEYVIEIKASAEFPEDYSVDFIFKAERSTTYCG